MVLEVSIYLLKKNSTSITSSSIGRTISNPNTKKLVDESEPKEYILGFSNNQMQYANKKKIEKKVFIIPLIDYTNPAPYISKAVKSINKTENIADSMDVDKSNEIKKESTQEIKQEIKQEVKAEIKDEKTLDQIAAEELIKEAQSGEVPLCMRNMIPGIANITDEQEKLRFDIASRPSETSLEAYENIPIEEFGMAMLLGMGYEEGKPIGKNGKGLVQPIQYVPRHHRTGLGAEPKMLLPSDVKQKKYIKPGESREPKPTMVLPKDADGHQRNYRNLDEKLVPYKPNILAPGASVAIISGLHDGLTGIVKLMDSENAIVVLPNDEHIEVSVSDLSLMNMQNAIEPIDNKKKRKENPSNENSSEDRKMSKSEQPKIAKSSWLRPHIIVRIISKTLKDGMYYNKKARVLDVASSGVCQVELLDASKKLLDGIKERWIETVIPKPDELVMVLKGEFIGKRGSVIQSDNHSAIVKILETLEFKTYPLDDISEFDVRFSSMYAF